MVKEKIIYIEEYIINSVLFSGLVTSEVLRKSKWQKHHMVIYVPGPSPTVSAVNFATSRPC